MTRVSRLELKIINLKFTVLPLNYTLNVKLTFFLNIIGKEQNRIIKYKNTMFQTHHPINGNLILLHIFFIASIP